RCTLFPYTTLFRSGEADEVGPRLGGSRGPLRHLGGVPSEVTDRGVDLSQRDPSHSWIKRSCPSPTNLLTSSRLETRVMDVHARGARWGRLRARSSVVGSSSE